MTMFLTGSAWAGATTADTRPNHAATKAFLGMRSPSIDYRDNSCRARQRNAPPRNSCQATNYRQNFWGARGHPGAGFAAMKRVGALEKKPCYAISSPHPAIQRTYKPLLDELNITYPQFLLLNALWEEDHLTVGDIGERLGIESSTLTPLLKRMQAAGFVERQPNPDDERQVFIE